jgi:cytoskeletal protein RodZ
MGVFGETLKQARAHKGVTLKEAEQVTRINRHHLAALEDEQFAVLPALIYQRGFVRNYATYLDLDPGKLLAMFEEARGTESSPDFGVVFPPQEIPRNWAPNFAIIAFMVLMSAIIFAWVYSLTFPSNQTPSASPTPAPTVTPRSRETFGDILTPTPSPTAPLPATSQTPTPRVKLDNDPPTPAAEIVSTSIPTAAPTATLPPPATETIAVSDNMQAAAVPPQGPTATIRVVATGDIYVTIVGDGAVYFDGWLGAGGSTDWMTASFFQVTTSDGNVTLFENYDHPEYGSFNMGYGLDETYWLSGSS